MYLYSILLSDACCFSIQWLGALVLNANTTVDAAVYISGGERIECASIFLLLAVLVKSLGEWGGLHVKVLDISVLRVEGPLRV